MIDTVILDWAGTTVDFGCMAPVDAFYQAFKQEGIEVTKAEIREPMGMKKHEHILKMLAMPNISASWQKKYGMTPASTDVDRIYKTFEAHVFQTLEQYSDVKHGVTEVIAELKEMGLNIGSTTGYTSEMMKIVAATAAEQGYAPDITITPDVTNGLGRPYPYMIFGVMAHFKTASVKNVLKIGDTLSDIVEGKNAGVFSLGLVEGSSLAGMSQDEYQALTAEEQSILRHETRHRFFDAGADGVIDQLTDLPEFIRVLNKTIL